MALDTLAGVRGEMARLYRLSTDVNRLSQAIDLIEQRKQARTPKIVKVRRGFEEDPDAARERHYAAHPEDRDADIVIFKFFDEEEIAEESRDC